MSAVVRAGRAGRAGVARLRAAPAPGWRIRTAHADDYPLVAVRVDAWSRGRFAGVALPRSFFVHFADTSLLAFEDGELAGVLVGFRSQAQPQVAYAHFVAIAPGSRRQGLGRALYQRFFERARALGCLEVHSIAPPVNSSLIAFHRQLGFQVVDGGGFCCGIAVFPDYAGPGQHRVLFRKVLAAHGGSP
jgi:GNAT superfamily N-acetyltransferase